MPGSSTTIWTDSSYRAWPCSVQLVARTPKDAVDAFAAAYQQAIGCLVQARVNVEGYRPIDLPYRADINGGRFVLIGRGSPLGLIVVLRYRLSNEESNRRAWGVRVASYEYTLTEQTGREIIAYHWDPLARSPITTPHLHLGPASGDVWRPLSQAHFPTGPIAIQDVIRFAITQLGALPQPSHPNWDVVLQRTRWVFDEQWPGLG